MNDERVRTSGRGLALALLASGAVGGIVARCYAVATLVTRAGLPASLTAAGQVTVFLLGMLFPLSVTLAVRVSPIGRKRLEERSGLVGLASGSLIGLVFGTTAAPLFSIMLLTLPKAICDFLVQ